jgi:hypothetical protein
MTTIALAAPQVQDVRLGRRAGFQRQFDGGEHGLLVMLEDKGQDLDHLAVAARRLEHALLQGAESRQHLKRRARRCARRQACAGRAIAFQNCASNFKR